MTKRVAFVGEVAEASLMVVCRLNGEPAEGQSEAVTERWDLTGFNCQ